LIAVLVCVFVSDDFRSGYAKNLFTVRAKKVDYVFSKSLVCFAGGAIMILAYFIGAMLGGAIAGLPFTMEGFNAGGIVACLFAKIFLVAVFVAIFLTFSVVAKQRTWLSILLSVGVGAFMFMMIPVMTPLNANFIHVIMTLAGGALFAVGLGAVSNVILNKTSLV
ncbi:MAG: ABC transporter permease, partial [Clostridia bacterium]|nr:ABC transporter permease [Clostridia bacterium]